MRSGRICMPIPLRSPRCFHAGRPPGDQQFGAASRGGGDLEPGDGSAPGGDRSSRTLRRTGRRVGHVGEPGRWPARRCSEAENGGLGPGDRAGNVRHPLGEVARERVLEPDGELLATAGFGEFMAQVVDLSGNRVAVLKEASGPDARKEVATARFSPDGRLVATVRIRHDVRSCPLTE
jgi:hypothetical protein